MLVKCIDNCGAPRLNIGGVYEAQKVIFGSIEYYEVDNVKYYIERFEIVPDCKVTTGKYEQIAINIGKLVDIKNKQYGDAINATGDMLKLLFPNGIKVEQYNDVGVIVRVFDKLKRIGAGNNGSENAWQDIAGYGILMAEEDNF